MQIYMNDKLRERLEALAAQKTAKELGLSDADVADASMEEVVGLLIQRHCAPIDQEAWYEEELNAVEGDVAICGYHYPAGSVWRNIDPVAFEKRRLFRLWHAVNDDERLVEVGGQYYFVEDVEAMLTRLS